MSKKTISLQMEDDIYDKIKEEANLYDRTVSSQIRYIVKEYFKNNMKEE